MLTVDGVYICAGLRKQNFATISLNCWSVTSKKHFFFSGIVETELGIDIHLRAELRKWNFA